MTTHIASTGSRCSVERMIELNMQRTPDHLALAVAGGGDRFTYRDLAERADMFARRFGDAGIGAGDRVAILSDNRPEFVVGLLATWKAGADAVPLDPQLDIGAGRYCLA